MKYELIYDDYDDPCGVRNGGLALSFTVDAEAIVTALDKAALFDEAWDALPVHIQEACEPDHAGDLMHAIGLLRREATLFDALAARIKAGEWRAVPTVPPGEVHIYIYQRGLRVQGQTLAEAIEAAMRAEGETK